MSSENAFENSYLQTIHKKITHTHTSSKMGAWWERERDWKKVAIK